MLLLIMLQLKNNGSACTVQDMIGMSRKKQIKDGEHNTYYLLYCQRVIIIILFQLFEPQLEGHLVDLWVSPSSSLVFLAAVALHVLHPE